MPDLQRTDTAADLLATTEITASSRLAPVAVCRAVLAELPPAGCGLDVGSKLARTLVGCYPKREVNDPQIFTYAVSSIFAEYPEAVGKQAIAEIIRKQKFLPVPAEVEDACKGIVGKIWTRRVAAKKTIREHERRQREAADRARLAADLADPEKRAQTEALLAEVMRNLNANTEAA